MNKNWIFYKRIPQHVNHIWTWTINIGKHVDDWRISRLERYDQLDG